MTDCPECVRLQEERAAAFSEYESCKDELAMTRKTDKSFPARREALKRATGRLSECANRQAHHCNVAHRNDRLPSDEEVEQKIAGLRKCIQISNADGVQQAIFDLTPVANGWRAVPDQVVEQLLAFLQDERMYDSELAGHVLTYFEFESSRLTARQKSLCNEFLNAYGDRFRDPFSQQLIAELRRDNYLR